jgi:hypothetical protein
MCSLVNNYLAQLARKFPQTKFLKGISSTCIPNYPDKNLPTIFVYFEDSLKKQWIGAVELGSMNLQQDGSFCGDLFLLLLSDGFCRVGVDVGTSRSGAV